MSERRKYMRFNVLMDAICRKTDTPQKLKINDFSKEGIGIVSENAFSKGEELEIEMMIPGDNIPVLFQGEVAWTGELKRETSSYKTGVKFKKIDNQDKSRMLEYIYQRWIMPKTGETN